MSRAPNKRLPNSVKKHSKKFWEKVSIKASGECWLVKGETVGIGHKRIWIADGRYLAHRVAYFLTFGRFKSTLCVLHQCDVPNCVNPLHLKLGTYADNAQDVLERNRRKKIEGKRGSSNWQAKLTEDQVRKIRKEWETHYYRGLGRELCKEYGIAPQTLCGIVKRRKWRHV